MVVGIKDSIKLISISVITVCAVFVCTLFLSYNIDIVSIRDEIISEQGHILYDAQVMTGKVVSAVSGGCLAITSVIMLIFYIKNYVDTHSKELGVLKALGYSDLSVAKHFWVFGLSVFLGCLIGYMAGFIYLPRFYEVQNDTGYLPDFKVHFHIIILFTLVVVPTVFFTVISILYAYHKLKTPVLDLIREKRDIKVKKNKKKETDNEDKDISFLEDLRASTLRGRKTLVFLIGFGTFCFSAMTQMSMSMDELSSRTMAVMMVSIGLILAFVTLFLALSSVVSANAKTIAMMRVFGYEDSALNNAILGGYRPIAYIGFVIGSVYQYVLLKIMVDIVFADLEEMPEYNFDFRALAISLVMFIISYEVIMQRYANKIRKVSVKSIMLEN